MFFFHTDSVVWIPKQSETTHMPMHSSIYAHTVTQPSAQALFSLFPVSHPTTLRSFLLLLAAWDKIQNERKYGCKLASVNCFFFFSDIFFTAYPAAVFEVREGVAGETPQKLNLGVLQIITGTLFEIIFFLYIRLHVFICKIFDIK